MTLERSLHLGERHSLFNSRPHLDILISMRPKHPYVTIEELRRDHSLLVSEMPGRADPRFSGSTDTTIAERYCPKDEPILECGPIFGAFTKWLQEAGYREIHALDFADMLTMPDRGKLTFHEINFNTERFPYEEGFFSSVCAWGIIEHLENPYHFIRELHRVLKSDGVLILAIPNVLHIVSRLKFLKNGYFPRWNKKDNHTFIMPRGIFEKAFLRHFDVLETKYIRPNLNLYSNTPRWYLPANEWFGNYAVYVLKKKPFESYA